ncbi:MAG: LytTR family DNA-binding domain-containing protein [Halocynthiibacter sp.]
MGFLKMRHDIKSYKMISKELRTLLLSKTCIIATATLLFFISLLTPGQYLFHLDFAARLMTNSVSTLYFLLLTYFCLPWALHWGLSRNIPWLWTELLFYVPVSFLMASALVFTFSPTFELSEVFLYFGLIMINVVLAVTLTMLLFKDAILRTFTDSPEYFPLWMPSPEHFCGLSSLLPSEKRGLVLRVEADNQYIHVVTDKGTSHLRMALTEAEKLVPHKDGIRIHRSHWVSKDHIHSLFSENGNPKIKDKSGTLLPVSRSAVDAVRGILENGKLK